MGQVGLGLVDIAPFFAKAPRSSFPAQPLMAPPPFPLLWPFPVSEPEWLSTIPLSSSQSEPFPDLTPVPPLGADGFPIVALLHLIDNFSPAFFCAAICRSGLFPPLVHHPFSSRSCAFLRAASLVPWFPLFLRLLFALFQFQTPSLSLVFVVQIALTPNNLAAVTSRCRPAPPSYAIGAPTILRARFLDSSTIFPRHQSEALH